LGENGAPAAQADLMAALLDELSINQVAVVGVSAGGPAALQFTLRALLPERGLPAHPAGDEAAAAPNAAGLRADRPEQRRQVETLADALVPARPRYDGVANDLRVQETLAELGLCLPSAGGGS
jgi:pimeloyl-ACP methyl ester carboxylesterase